MSDPVLTREAVDLLYNFLTPVRAEAGDEMPAREVSEAVHRHRRALVVFLENAMAQFLTREFSIPLGTMPAARTALNQLRQNPKWRKKTSADRQAVANAIAEVLADWTDLTQGGGYSGNRTIPERFFTQTLPRLLDAFHGYAKARGDAELAERLAKAVAMVRETFHASA